MEMEGRGFPGLYKNTSEELFLKTVMESPIGMPVPTMEMLGFKAVSQSFRADSEELFKRWLTNGEASSYITLDHLTLLFLFCLMSNIRSKQKISMMPVCLTNIFLFEVSERIPELYISDLCIYDHIHWLTMLSSIESEKSKTTSPTLLDFIHDMIALFVKKKNFCVAQIS